MKSCSSSLLFVLFPFLIAGQPALAQDKSAAKSSEGEKPWYEKVKISGLLFGDAYYLSNHPDGTIRGQSGFWLRRGYLTVDSQLAESWSLRLRFEVNSPGDFKTQANLQPYVKDAYVARQFQNGEFQSGIVSTPTWEFTEAFWGYRSVEKTPADLYRLGSARDFGVAGKWSAQGGKIKLHGTVGNGAGIGSETNKGKNLAISAGFFPNPKLAFELYADSDDRPGRSDRTTYHAFLGFKTKAQRYGLQYLQQDRQRPSGGDLRVRVASAYGVWKLTERGSLLARFDRALDPNPEGDRIPYLVLSKNHEFNFFLVGFDWTVSSKIHFIPNVELVRYRAQAGLPTPEDVAIGRLTLFVEF